MIKKELEKREDIRFLIHTFYAKVREDEMLGPIFNAIVEDWPEHLERLTDFWESSLLLKRSYTGNPAKVHKEVDKQVNNSIGMAHFGQWLHLWLTTIDAHFSGTNAEIAKNRARKMSTQLFLHIYEGRKNP